MRPKQFFRRLFCMTILLHVPRLFASPLVKHCTDDAPRINCGGWSVGGYYTVSPKGEWFAGLSAGGEYFVLRDLGLGASLSPGFGDGYFYLAPSLEVNYYIWYNQKFEVLAGYSFRYFYDWPLKQGEAESNGTFHGPGVSGLYGFSDKLYGGANISYQWVRFGGETLREWYFTLPLVWFL